MRLCATYYIERQIYLAFNIPEEEGSMGEMENKQVLDEMEDSIRTVGVLTSGGDAPGMNAALRAVVRTA